MGPDGEYLDRDFVSVLDVLRYGSKLPMYSFASSPEYSRLKHDCELTESHNVLIQNQANPESGAKSLSFFNDFGLHRSPSSSKRFPPDFFC